jgi:hypothetical protein
MRKRTPGLLSATVSILGLVAAACGGLTTTPSATPIVSAAPRSPLPSTAAGLPQELVHPWFRWTQATTKWDGVGSWILGIETPTMVRHGDEEESSAGAVDNDTLELVAATAADGCVVGDTGTYDWSVSSNSRTLHLEPQVDQCASRMADFEGDWIVSDCPAYPEDFCLGPLDPGPHVANFFTPLVPSDDWRLDPAAMSYRVSDGWSNTYDAGNEYLLEPLVKAGPTGVFMWTDVTIVSPEGPCTPQPWAEGRATPSEMVAFLAEQETLETSLPVTVEVGGLKGLSLDVTVLPGSTPPCTGDGIPYQPFLVHVEGSGLQSGFEKNTRNRLYFLDTANGRTLVIHVAAAGENTEHLLADGIGVVESIELRR